VSSRVAHAVAAEELPREAHRPGVARRERRGGDHHRHGARLEPLLGLEPEPPRHAAVMRGDASLTEPLLQLVGHPLDQAAGVDEDDGGALGPRVGGDAVVDLGPELVGRDRPQLLVCHLDGEREVATVADVDDAARRRFAAGTRADQQPGHLLDRPLRRREPDALETAAGERVEPFEREREVGAALVGCDRMDLVDDRA